MNDWEACAAYFKDRHAYDRVFALMREKMRSGYGLGASIRIASPTEEEKEVLGAFLEGDFRRGELRFTMRQFAHALETTRYAGVALADVIGAYFGAPIKTNRAEAEEEAERRAAFFDSLTAMTDDESMLHWLKTMQQDKSYGYALVLGLYRANPEEAAAVVGAVCRAVQILVSGRRIRLAMLAALATSDPHAFDRDEPAGRLLLEALSYRQRQSTPANAEEVLLLYYQSGIRPDDISSFTAVFGIRLYDETGEHEACAAFIRRAESYVLTLANLERADRAKSFGDVVYIVENQMVFSHLCEQLSDCHVSLICTSGRMKSASWVLLDLLYASGAVFFYSGDLDPEGLSIAQKLLLRYPERSRVWHMGQSDYALACSQTMLPERRLHELEAVTHPALQGAKTAILDGRAAGYQEKLAGLLLADLREAASSFKKSV